MDKQKPTSMRLPKSFIDWVDSVRGQRKRTRFLLEYFNYIKLDYRSKDAEYQKRAKAINVELVAQRRRYIDLLKLARNVNNISRVLNNNEKANIKAEDFLDTVRFLTVKIEKEAESTLKLIKLLKDIRDL